MTPPQRAFSSMVPPVGSDSMAKMLPSVPDMDTQIALAAKMIDKRTSTPKVTHHTVEFSKGIWPRDLIAMGPTFWSTP